MKGYEELQKNSFQTYDPIVFTAMIPLIQHPLFSQLMVAYAALPDSRRRLVALRGVES